MTLTPCTCGRRPELTERIQQGINILRVECKCGNRGATLMFTKREDREKMNQAAADGWNLNQGIRNNVWKG